MRQPQRLPRACRDYGVYLDLGYGVWTAAPRV